MMRIIPLAIWATEVSDPSLHRMIIAEQTKLTHLNGFVHDACFIYCQAIGYLLRNSNDANRFVSAFEHVCSLAKKHGNSSFQGHSIEAWLTRALELFN